MGHTEDLLLQMKEMDEEYVESIEDMKTEHAEEVAELKRIARAYRSILWVADDNGNLTRNLKAELEGVDRLHGDTIED